VFSHVLGFSDKHRIFDIIGKEIMLGFHELLLNIQNSFFLKMWREDIFFMEQWRLSSSCPVIN
jgi:hypothetical protein